MAVSLELPFGRPVRLDVRLDGLGQVTGQEPYETDEPYPIRVVPTDLLSRRR